MSVKAKAPAKVDPLQKKITPNPKYKDVMPVVDSGASVSRYMRRLAEISQNYRYRKDEIFKRIKITTFAQLVLQVTDLQRDTNDVNLLENEPELDGATEIDEPDVELADLTHDGDASDRIATLRQSNTNGANHATEPTGANTPAAAEGNGADNSRSRSSLQSVISGFGELDIKRGQANSASGRGAHRDHNATSELWWKSDGSDGDRGRDSIADSRRCTSTAITDENRNESSARSKAPSALAAAVIASPYILLDVRDRDEYDAGHIRTALSYPIAMLSRSVNAELPEMRAFRNEPGRIIIVYDADESLAPRVATTLVQRGYDNLFVLSGGLRVTRKLFPEGLVLTRPRDDLQTQVSSGVSEFDAEAVDKVRSALEAHMLRGAGTSSSMRTSSRGSVASSTGSRAGTRAMGNATPSRLSTASSTASGRSTFK